MWLTCHHNHHSQWFQAAVVVLWSCPDLLSLHLEVEQPSCSLFWDTVPFIHAHKFNRACQYSYRLDNDVITQIVYTLIPLAPLLGHFGSMCQESYQVLDQIGIFHNLQGSTPSFSFPQIFWTPQDIARFQVCLEEGASLRCFCEGERVYNEKQGFQFLDKFRSEQLCWVPQWQ